MTPSPRASRVEECPPRDAIDELDIGERVRALHGEVARSSRHLCVERAVLITEFFREADRQPSKRMITKKAEGLAHILRKKKVNIRPRELLVGTFTSHRVGGGLFPSFTASPCRDRSASVARGESDAVRAEDRRILLRE